MNKLTNLKRKRKELGLTREEIAKEIGISIHTYAAYEKGVRKPLFDTLIKILKVLNCTLDDLTKEEEFKEDKKEV